MLYCLYIINAWEHVFRKWCIVSTQSFEWILLYRGLKAPTITQYFQAENIDCARQNVAIFIKKYSQTKSICRRSGSGRPSKITAEVKAIVEEEMRKDDETTAHQLHRLLLSRGYRISLHTILCCRTSLGWTFRGSVYSQLIHDVNKVKRLAWATVNLGEPLMTSYGQRNLL